MARYVLDTNVLVAYLRGGGLYKKIEEDLGLSLSENQPIISVATVAELNVLASRNKWGRVKRNRLSDLLDNLITIDIQKTATPLLDAYTEIDSFSQGHHPDIQSNFTSRNMGKNDLWIAATAVAVKASLVTTDADFDHLAPHFCPVIRYQV